MKSLTLRSNPTSTKTVSFFEETEEGKGESEKFYLKRKISTSSVLEVEIPSFLHDKKNGKFGGENLKEEDQSKNEKENVKECLNGNESILIF